MSIRLKPSSTGKVRSHKRTTRNKVTVVRAHVKKKKKKLPGSFDKSAIGIMPMDKKSSVSCMKKKKC